MVNFKNNNRRGRYRNNERNFRRNNDGMKYKTDFVSSSKFQRKSPGKNNHNASKLVEKYNDLAREALANEDKIISPSDKNNGVDIYISTSSAGGGLQMMVAGVVKTMSGESAERAALGAGSIVMDFIASNDGRLPHEKIKRIRELRPDMILLSGGIDGGSVSHVVELAEILKAANPQPRLGSDYKLPVIYAGNNKASDEITKTLDVKLITSNKIDRSGTDMNGNKNQDYQDERILRTVFNQKLNEEGNIINIDKDEGLAISLVTEIIKPEQLSFEDSKNLVKEELTAKVQFEKAMKKAEDIKKRVKKGEKLS